MNANSPLFKHWSSSQSHNTMLSPKKQSRSLRKLILRL